MQIHIIMSDRRKMSSDMSLRVATRQGVHFVNVRHAELEPNIDLLKLSKLREIFMVGIQGHFTPPLRRLCFNG